MRVFILILKWNVKLCQIIVLKPNQMENALNVKMIWLSQMVNASSRQDRISIAPNKMQRENAQNVEVSMNSKKENVFLLAKILSVKQEHVNAALTNVLNAKKATSLTTMEFANLNPKTVKNSAK